MDITMLYGTDDSWDEIMTVMADYVRSFREEGKRVIQWHEIPANSLRKRGEP